MGQGRGGGGEAGEGSSLCLLEHRGGGHRQEVVGGWGRAVVGATGRSVKSVRGWGLRLGT